MFSRASRCLFQANRRPYGLARSTPQIARIPVFRSTPRPRIATSTSKLSAAARSYSSHPGSPPGFQWKDSNINTKDIRVQTPSQPHWANQEILAVDLPIKTNVFSMFMGFTCWGDLPNGKRTSLPLMQPEETMLWMEPMAAWAPAPYATNSPEAPGSQTLLRTTTEGNSDRVSLLGKNIHAFKTHLMEGLVPLSDAQWKGKGLDHADRLETACEYLTGVAAVFEYLSIAQVESNLRDTFNVIYDDLHELGAALNARRRIHAPNLPDLDLPALWVEFMAATYEVMTSTAHSWMISKIAQLKERLLDRFCAVASLPADKVPTERERLQQLWQFLTDITITADVGIWMLMDGYKGFRPPPEGIVPGLYNPNLDASARAYQPRLHELAESRLKEVMEAQAKAGNANSAASLRERVSTMTYAQDQLRLEMRGQAPEPPTAPWIQQLIQNEQEMQRTNPQGTPYTFGFAIYGSAGELSHEEWEAVKQKVEDHVASWGEGVKGAERIKPLLKLYWHDCAELDLDLKDTEAIKSHFRTSRAADTDPLGMSITESTFLILDPWSLASYRDPKTYDLLRKDKLFLPGDFQPHLLAVDPYFVPDSPSSSIESQPTPKSNQQQTKTAPNNNPSDTDTDTDTDTDKLPPPPPAKYTGHMRILGTLIWSELYALVSRNGAALEDLFPLAMEHPQKLYTGLTVPSQIRAWREHTTLHETMMGAFVQYLDQRDPRAAETVREMRGRHVL
ncbi:hypothetical protein BJX64DRAFT_256700 [Aspergillus heterothallicus]